MRGRLDWERHGRDWPNREASRFVSAAGQRWHVQVMGRGPVVLLLHGTGGATHSWGPLAPRLADRFTVVAPDLPGHGFSDTPRAAGFTLPGMARSLGELLRVLGVRPSLGIGHSAGAAVLCRMCLDGWIAPRTVVSVNGALLPLRGVSGQVFSPLAKLLTWNPLVPRVLARRAADPRVVDDLIRQTGSCLQPEDVRLYDRLARSAKHVAAALRMMASWDLRPLAEELPLLAPRLVLVVGSRDRFISPSDAYRVQRRVPNAVLVTLPGLGHLAHEEKPEAIEAVLERLGEATDATDAA